MKIGIIGAGNIGGNLTRRLSALGHQVYVANSRGPETLAGLARETGAIAVTPGDAAGQGQLIITSIPLKNIPKLPRALFADTPASAVLVDTGNYYPQRDGLIAEIEAGTTETRWVSQQLGRPVVKAFNNIYAQHLLDLGKPAGSAGRIALPVAGDNQTSKQIVIDLLDQLGFDGVDAGSLDESWRQQPGTPVFGTDFDAAGVRRALAEASPERPIGFRAATAPKPAAPRAPPAESTPHAGA